MDRRKGLGTQFFRYTSATVVSLMIFSLYSMVDGLFVARGVGEYAMSAVNLAVPFTNLLFSLAVLFAVGTSTLIAIFLGQERREDANRLFSQNLAVLAVLGLLLTAAVGLFPSPIARLLGARDVTLPYTAAYLRGLAPFSVCFMLSYNLEILVKTGGHPRLAILTVSAGCLSNCLLDYLAVFVLDWGVTGAAVATGLSQLLTCAIYLRHFLRGGSAFRPVAFSMDWGIYRRLLPIGTADALTELCNGVMIFLYNRTVLRWVGQDGLVSYTIIAYVNTLVLNTLLGISQGAQPLISYHHGRRDRSACRRLLRYGLITVTAASVLCLGGLYLLAPQLAGAFLGTHAAALIPDSAAALRRWCLCYPPVGFNILAGGYLTAVERPRPAIALSVGRGLAVQSACLLALAAMGGGVLWYTPLLSELLCLGAAGFALSRYGR